MRNPATARTLETNLAISYYFSETTLLQILHELRHAAFEASNSSVRLLYASRTARAPTQVRRAESEEDDFVHVAFQQKPEENRLL